MKKLIQLSLFLFFISTSISAQLSKDVFPFSRQYLKGGFYISPLLTYPIGFNTDHTYTNLDTTYNYSSNGSGKLSYGLEAGWYRTFDNLYVVDFIEGGIGYRRFKGGAKHDGELLIAGVPTLNFNSDNKFDHQVVTAAIRFMGETQAGARRFLTYGLGLNYYYEISKNYEREIIYPHQGETFQTTSTLQAHLIFGYGFKVNDVLLLIPTIETPFLSAYPTGDLDPRLTFFSAEYQPIIIGLRFMFMRKDPMNCNAPQLLGSPKVK